jgi:N-acetylneuraminic acid mutarotase
VAYHWTPEGASWKAIQPLNKPRTRFGAIPLRDGRVLVVGGLNDADQSYSSTYVFDPERPSRGWSKVGLLDTARTAPSVTTLPDGRVLVAGGYFHTGGTRSPSGVRSARFDAGVAALGDIACSARWRRHRRSPYGYALATAELFDPATGEWTPTGNLNYARAGAPAVTLADGRVLIVGTGEDSLERSHRRRTRLPRSTIRAREHSR